VLAIDTAQRRPFGTACSAIAYSGNPATVEPVVSGCGVVWGVRGRKGAAPSLTSLPQSAAAQPPPHLPHTHPSPRQTCRTYTPPCLPRREVSLARSLTGCGRHGSCEHGLDAGLAALVQPAAREGRAGSAPCRYYLAAWMSARNPTEKFQSFSWALKRPEIGANFCS
jgi:hypothetical protein